MDGDDLADLEERESLVHSGSEDAGSECSKAPSEEEPPAAAAPGKGRGRGRGRGKGAGRGRGRGRGAKGRGMGAQDAAGDDAGGAPGPAPPKPSKYVWVDASEHVFSPRVEFEGELLPTLSSKFDGLTVDSEPWEWFKVMDAPEKEYHDRASNSEKYRGYRYGNDLDGPSKRCYDGAGEILYQDIRYLDAYTLLLRERGGGEWLVFGDGRICSEYE